MKIRLGPRTLMLGTMTTLVVGAIALAVLGAGGIVAWEYSNSNAFCTNMCHAVHPEEPIAHAASFHARVNCVECHMGRLSTLQLMAIKPTHINELIGMITGYERPITTHSLRPARESCEACHWPEARHDDTIRIKYRYGDDPKSSEGRTTLQMHTGTGTGDRERRRDITPQLRPGGAVAKGIHWHIAQDVEYVALGPAEAEDRAGRDPRRGRQGEGDLLRRYRRRSPAPTPRRCREARMDCIDCHNASGHPFTNPARSRRRRDRGRTHRSQPAVDQGALRRDHQERRRHRRSGQGARREIRAADRRGSAEGQPSGQAKDAEKKFTEYDAADPDADVVQRRARRQVR